MEGRIEVGIFSLKESAMEVITGKLIEVCEIRTLGFAPMQNPKARTFHFTDFSYLSNNCALFSPDNSSLIEKVVTS